MTEPATTGQPREQDEQQDQEQDQAQDKDKDKDKDAKASEEHIPEGEVIYRAIRKDGDHALAESTANLAWSGMAAGMSMGFSLAGEGLLKAHLPEAPWTPLLSKLGYALGFLMVILGRQQLVTEQTLTAILPLLSRDRPAGVIGNVARLWTTVLIANLAGAALFAAASAWTPAFSPEVQAAFLRIGHDAMSASLGATFVRGIYAGFIIATMVWLLPGAGAARLWIVVILAYVVGVASLAHVIAGSAECLFVVFKGEATLAGYVGGFLLPSLLGNSVGGVALVASLAHAQHAPESARQG
jgi:formate/nitrite transporter FocA (FNT family)